jgi:hypothetical protein
MRTGSRFDFDLPANAAAVERRSRATGETEGVSVFLDSASEDEFTERVLVTLFQRLGFYRVSAAGHTEKMREFGKDLWMKFQLPTIPGKLKLS